MFEFLRKAKKPEGQAGVERQPRVNHSSLPLSPEDNPPDSLEELDALVKQLQHKVDSINMRLMEIQADSKEGLPVDKREYRSAVYAKTRTNRSINALQQIAKKRRMVDPSNKYDTVNAIFVKLAKAQMGSEEFNDLMREAVKQYKQQYSSAG